MKRKRDDSAAQVDDPILVGGPSRPPREVSLMERETTPYCDCSADHTGPVYVVVADRPAIYGKWEDALQNLREAQQSTSVKKCPSKLAGLFYFLQSCQLNPALAHYKFIFHKLQRSEVFLSLDLDVDPVSDLEGGKAKDQHSHPTTHNPNKKAKSQHSASSFQSRHFIRVSLQLSENCTEGMKSFFAVHRHRVEVTCPKPWISVRKQLFGVMKGFDILHRLSIGINHLCSRPVLCPTVDLLGDDPMSSRLFAAKVDEKVETCEGYLPVAPFCSVDGDDGKGCGGVAGKEEEGGGEQEVEYETQTLPGDGFLGTLHIGGSLSSSYLFRCLTSWISKWQRTRWTKKGDGQPVQNADLLKVIARQRKGVRIHIEGPPPSSQSQEEDQGEGEEEETEMGSAFQSIGMCL